MEETIPMSENMFYLEPIQDQNKNTAKDSDSENQNANYVQLSMANLSKKIRYDNDDKFLACLRSRPSINLLESIIIVKKFYK